MKTDDKKPAPKKTVPGRVFDVSRPGKAPASPTSRPVIMGHKPEAQAAQTAVSGIGEASPLLAKRKIQVLPAGDPAEEPMVAPPADTSSVPEDVPAGAPLPTPTDTEEGALGATAVEATSGPPALPPEKAAEPIAKPEQLPAEKPKLVIAPASESETQEETPEPEASGPEAPKAETSEAEAPAEPTSEAKPEEAAPAPDLPTSSLASSSVPDSEATIPEESAVDPLKPQETPPYPKIDPLFDEAGHIVVSHHNHHQRHAVNVVALLLLIVLLAVVAFDVVLDLDLLKVDGLPHTNLL